MKSIILTTLVLVVVVHTGESQRKPKPMAMPGSADCQAMMDKSDRCFKKILLLGDAEQDTPLTAGAMDLHCK